MNPEIWWHVARASGIISWLMLTATVLWGIVLATDLFPEHRRPAWLSDAHRWLAALSLWFLGLHLGALVADSYAEFGLAELAIPMASEWKPVPVAVGVVSMWLLLVVQATSLAMRRLPRRLWRLVHLSSYLAFWLASLHGTLAGTDAASPIYTLTSILTLLAVVFGVIYRILGRRRRASR
ncbi:MAG: ferric reductase-like transmembrane domain-containing protein [Actinobacteria bacterium]|nr:ferric reductase-like transmembrane domain-containing protein [Actinomycetota bacterium]